MAYFLAKTDPDTYSVTDFQREGRTVWDGVHNYQAIAAIKSMRPQDMVFIYHSQSDKAIVGLATVVGEPYENKADPRFSWAVEMQFERLTKPLTLAAMKQAPQLEGFVLLRNARLSTMTVPETMAAWILEQS